MKTTFKVCTAIMGLGLVILIGLHLFLQFGLTRMMRDVVLPRVKAETGIDVRVGHLSLNLPRGTLNLNNVVIRNPHGFILENLASIDRIQIEVELRSLMKQKPLRFKNVEVKNGLLNIVRNEAGEFNLDRLTAAPPPGEIQAVPSDRIAESPKQPRSVESHTVPAESKALPEVLIEGLSFDLSIHYFDFRLDQYDIALDLGVVGGGISTQQGPDVPSGQIAVIGSLGDDRTSFVTDIKIILAPITDPAAPTFDLTGRVMEVDPDLIKDVYDKVGIRSAPFGIEPMLHCRNGLFENSTVSVNLRDVQFEEKLSDRLGGMASISSLRFPIKVEGSLQQPTTDLSGALVAAIGGNAESILDAFLKGAVSKEANTEEPPESLSEAAVDILGAHVEEIGESEELKTELKNLGKWLFGE